jgi:hypothetical protein
MIDEGKPASAALEPHHASHVTCSEPVQWPLIAARLKACKLVIGAIESNAAHSYPITPGLTLYE